MSKQRFPHTHLLDIVTRLVGVLGISSLIASPAFSQNYPTSRSYTTPNGDVINIITPSNTVISPDNQRITTPAGSFTTNTGFTANPNGSLTTNGTNVTPSGLIISADGQRITTPTGSVTSSVGFFANLDGSFSTPSGTVIMPNGTIFTPSQSVITPNSQIRYSQ